MPGSAICSRVTFWSFFFFFNDTATTEIYTLSLHDALPIYWIRGVIDTRRRYPDPRAPEIVNSVYAAISEAVAAGTALVGDISNTLVTNDPLVRSPLAAVVFFELIRFKAADATAAVDQALDAIGQVARSDHVRASLAAHAPDRKST